MKYLLSLLLLLFSFSMIAQDAEKQSFFTKSDTFNKKKFWILTGTITTSYTASYLLLDKIWYSGYPRNKFHFYNDLGEWEDMDKVGHLYGTYFISKWGKEAFSWTGLNHRQSTWAGAGAGLTFVTLVETLDGFSEGWGFSYGDMIMNASGATLFLSQELLWEEQRINLKYSAHKVKYSDELVTSIDGGESMSLKERARNLYGSTGVELAAKDYNGMTVWASGNIHAFMKNKNSKFPKWLNIAVGYGAENMYGGFDNNWTTEDGVAYTAPPELGRYRQFYLSADIDLTRIPTKSKGLKWLFHALNIIKIPAPALEISNKGKFKFHPIYF